MKTLILFKLYNVRQWKRDIWLLIFTALSIFIAANVSMIIPLISIGTKEHHQNILYQFNGGDLKVLAEYPSTQFDAELQTLHKEGIEYKEAKLFSAFFEGEKGKRIIGRGLIGEYHIQPDEIILFKSLAKEIGVKKGDKVTINIPNGGAYSLELIHIEEEPMAVDRDAELLGYGKVNMKLSNEIVTLGSLYTFEGVNGEMLKNRLKAIEKGYEYSSIEDAEKSLADKLSVQVKTLSLLSMMGYLLAGLTIFSSLSVLLYRRQRDIAILRMLPIKSSQIKVATWMELSGPMILIILVGAITAFIASEWILTMNGITTHVEVKKQIGSLLTGMIFNTAIFCVFLGLSLAFIHSIKPISLVRDDAEGIKKDKRKVAQKSITWSVLGICLYSILTKNLTILVAFLCLMVLVACMYGTILLLLKIISFLSPKDGVYLFTCNSVKKRFYSFFVLTVSLTLTLWLTLISLH